MSAWDHVEVNGYRIEVDGRKGWRVYDLSAPGAPEKRFARLADAIAYATGTKATARDRHPPNR